MDNSRTSPGKQEIMASSGPRRPLPSRYYLLVAILVVVVIVLAIFAIHGLIQSSEGRQGQQVLQSEDNFLYNISGYNDGKAITPSAYNATIHDLRPIQGVRASFGTTTNVTVGYSAGWNIAAVDTHSAGQDTITQPNLGHDFHPLWDGPHSSMLTVWSPDGNIKVLKIDNEIISTDFGEKAVNVLTINDMNYNESMKVYVGQDTSLIYRWSVSSFSGAYQYTYELTYSSNPMLSSADPV